MFQGEALSNALARANSFFISFPGLGIEPFQMNKIVIPYNEAGTRGIAWYGLIICIGMVLAFLYGCRACRREKVSVDDFLNMLLLVIPFGVIGARLYHILMELEHYIGRPFMDWIAIWNGGLAIYGAIIAGAICIIVYCLIKKLSLLKVLDVFAAPLLIGQALGRWGNFCNGEAYGSVTDLPWRMGLGVTEEIVEFVHPTFLYESLWNVVLLCIIHFILAKHKKYDGEIVFFYAAFYGLGRALVECFRVDDSPVLFGSVRIAGFIGICLFVLFGTLFVLGFVRARRRPMVAATSWGQEGVIEKQEDKPSVEPAEEEVSSDETSTAKQENKE